MKEESYKEDFFKSWRTFAREFTAKISAHSRAMKGFPKTRDIGKVSNKIH